MKPPNSTNHWSNSPLHGRMSGMRVLIVPDKFKGTLTAFEAADAIAHGWHSKRPNDSLECVPMSDGGDGFGPILGAALGAREESTPATNAAGEPIQASWWWAKDRQLAIVETAQANGLAMLPNGRFHPFELDTRGVGLLLKAAWAKGARHILAGIGGSATNDGGFGMARALGWEFLDPSGQSITQWTRLEALDRVIPPSSPLPGGVEVASDVENPLLGPRGATRVYGPQKGIRPEDHEKAESCLRRLAEVWRSEFGSDPADEPGAGAAGGLGYGLKAFLKAKFHHGFEIFANLSNLRQWVAESDLVLTGEGSIDDSSLMGKGTGAVARLALSLGKPCLGLCGFVAAQGSLEGSGFTSLHGICPTLAQPEEAMRHPAHWLSQLAQNAATLPN